MKTGPALRCFWWVILTTVTHPTFGQTDDSPRAQGAVPTNEFTAIHLPSAAAKRLQWNRLTLVDDYEHNGQRNARWDNAARQALELFAQLRCVDAKDEKARTQMMADLTTKVSAAVAQGCGDPMIRYLFARFELPNRMDATASAAVVYRSVAEAMTASKRPPIRKFYAALRASEAANNGSATAQPEIRKWHLLAKQFLGEAAKETNAPPVELCEAWSALLDNVTRNKELFNDSYLSLESVMFTGRPVDAGLLLLRGYFYTEFAWEARGGGYAQSVTDQGWSLYSRRLDMADQALRKAWELNPQDERIARRMITVELGLGRGRNQMELWFNRAMELNPNYYDACYAKLHYLKPQWYGSKEEMLAFASECLTSTNWGGNVPLIVIDYHNYFANAGKDPEARKEYYRQPAVWPDVKQAFDKYFRLNPTNVGWHHDYALYAYWAQQWDDLNRELKLLGKINYNFFGGKAEFDKMVEAAQAHASAANAP